MELTAHPIVFAKEKIADGLKGVLPERTVFVRNRRELFGAMFTRGAIAFVDYDLIDTIDGANVGVPVVAIMDSPAQAALANTISALSSHPWLSHIIQAPFLAMDRARAHFNAELDRIVSNGHRSALSPNSIGRSALLARASRREARFDRMREFFESQGIAERLVTTLVDVGEELVMNGLYNAPTEAGFFKTPKSRAEDVELPPERACEISYGIDDTRVFLKVRDTFGALERSRLLDVLSRCNAEGVVLDESRGGAGLGLWRIFSSASSISITVQPGTHTDITVVIGKQDSRRIARPLAVDLYFARTPVSAALADDDGFLVDQSITFALRRGGSITPSPIS